MYKQASLSECRDAVIVRIPCNGKRFIIDKEDAKLVKGVPWNVTYTHQTKETVNRRDYASGRHLYLSRLIADAKPGQQVRFIDGNPTNLRRCNLKVVNMRYRKATSPEAKPASPASPKKRTPIGLGQKGGKLNTPVSASDKALCMSYFAELMTAVKAYNEASRALHKVCGNTARVLLAIINS